MKITINEPCHENWDQMTPNDKGAFCLSCQKNVIDFSSKTIGQIKDFFRKKAETESVCGRFDESQLNELSFDDFFGRFRKWQFLHRTAVIVFFVFGFALFGNAQVKPNHEPLVPKMGAVAYVPQDTTKKICKKDTTSTKIIKGKVKQTAQSPKKKTTTSMRLMGDVDVKKEEK